MRIAIASGKGGAGKTTLTASLHQSWPRPHVMADTDVEAPNLHLFLHPVMERSIDVALSVPAAVNAACTSCGQCRDICHYGGIARFGNKITLFPDMCHGCGGCFVVCPEHALEEGRRALGTVELGHLADGTLYVSGATRIGEVMTPPLLRRLLAELDLATQGQDVDMLLDSPPGVSCPAITVARRVDAVLLVVDPTPFGLADFRIAFAAFSALHLPLAVVINRAHMPGNEGGEAAVADFCAGHGLPIVGVLPFSREAAHVLAQGEPLVATGSQWQTLFAALAQKILHVFGGAANV
ncbi:MAG: 4Fe-4S binding protein [Desulfovibrio sp.]|nr:4Fe-4S binding protein [Desulfovibrio sp.]